MSVIQMQYCIWVNSGCTQATFAYGAGPLSWSIIAFRNSLVFHSLDKVS